MATTKVFTDDHYHLKIWFADGRIEWYYYMNLSEVCDLRDKWQSMFIVLECLCIADE